MMISKHVSSALEGDKFRLQQLKPRKLKLLLADTDTHNIKICQDCEDSLISVQSRNIHNNKLFNLGAQMIKRKSFTSQMSALCPAIQCCQTFNNMDNLQTHLEMHPSHNIIESKSTLVFHTPMIRISLGASSGHHLDQKKYKIKKTK